MTSKETIIKNPDRAEKKLETLIPRFEEKASAKFERMKKKIGKTESVSIEKYLKRVRNTYREIKTCEYSIPERLVESGSI